MNKNKGLKVLKVSLLTTASLGFLSLASCSGQVNIPNTGTTTAPVISNTTSEIPTTTTDLFPTTTTETPTTSVDLGFDVEIGGIMYHFFKGDKFSSEDYILPEHADYWILTDGTKVEDGYELQEGANIYPHYVGKCNVKLINLDEEHNKSVYHGDTLTIDILDDNSRLKFTGFKINGEASNVEGVRVEEENLTRYSFVIPEADALTIEYMYEYSAINVYIYNSYSAIVDMIPNIPTVSYREPNSETELSNVINSKLEEASNSISVGCDYDKAFGGFYVDEALTTELTIEYILASNEDINVYSKLEEKEPDGTISFVTGTNDVIEDYKFYKGHLDKEDLLGHLGLLEKEDYDFKFWTCSLDNPSELTYYDIQNINSNDNSTLYAYFTPKEFNLTVYNVISEEGAEVSDSYVESVYENSFNIEKEDGEFKYGDSVQIFDIVNKLEYDFDNCYLDERLTIPLSNVYENGEILLKGSETVTVYIKYNYKLPANIDKNSFNVEVPEYYTEKVYSELDSYTVTFDVFGDVDLNEKVVIKYESNQEEFEQEGVVGASSNGKQAIFKFNIFEANNFGISLKEFVFPNIISPVNNEAISYNLDIQLERYDYSDFEQKDIILTRGNVYTIKEDSHFNKYVSDGDEWRNSLTAPNVKLNANGEIEKYFTVTTAKNVLNADIYVYEDISIDSQEKFDSTFFGRDYILNGGLDLNGNSFEINFDGDYKTMLFEALNGEVKNGSLNLRGKRKISTFKDEFGSIRNNLNSMMFVCVLANSSLTDLSISTDLGFDFGSNVVCSQNNLIEFVGADVNFNNISVDEYYNFALEDEQKFLRVYYYNVTNNYGTFGTVSGTYKVYQEYMSKHPEGFNFETWYNEYRMNLASDNTTPRLLENITINVCEYSVSDFIKNNPEAIDIYSRDSYLEDGSWNLTEDTDFVSTSLDYSDYAPYCTQENSEYDGKGFYAPRINFFAKKSVSKEGYFAIYGAHIENNDEEYSTIVNNSELVANDITLTMIKKDFDLGQTREYFFRINTFTYIKGKDETSAYVRVYSAYEYSNGTKNTSIYEDLE